MAAARPLRRSDYAVRALGVVLAGAATHFVLAQLLLWLIERNHDDAGLRAGATLVVVSTALAALAFLYVRTQYSSPDHVARTIPRVFLAAPPLFCALFFPVTLPTSLLAAGWVELAIVAAPGIAAAWAGSMLVAIVGARLLRGLAARYPPQSDLGLVKTDAPPTLARSQVWILAPATAVAALAAAGSILARPEIGSTFEISIVSTGLVLLVGVAAIAGMSLGQTPGRDIVSIARRLDGLGYGSMRSQGSPIVVTSLDEVGELLSRLESLRSHLDEEARLYEEALDKTKAADALKSDFLSAVSHELRTPLNAVGGYAQLLLESTELSDAQAEDVRLIQAGGQQLLELINDILDISMIESGELRLSFRPTNVSELIAEVVNIHQPLVREKEVALVAELGPDLPQVVCDRRRLMQILTNLVSNAVKFTEDGSITLRAAFDPRHDQVVIRCIDTGVGIAANELDAVFEEYRQVGSVKRRTKGTGLGLAIARQIAQHHGGSLTVESTPGRGSTFTLNLPLDPPSKPEAIDMAEEAARTMARGRRLMSNDVDSEDGE